MCRIRACLSLEEASCPHHTPSPSLHSLFHPSVQFSCSVMSDFLQPHELQHARSPCPSPSPGVHSNSRQSSRWWHWAVSSSVVPFSSCPQSLPASVFSNESTLRMRWPKYWRKALASFLPMNTQGWSPLEWTGWISLQSKGLSHMCLQFLPTFHNAHIYSKKTSISYQISSIKICFLEETWTFLHTYVEEYFVFSFIQ